MYTTQPIRVRSTGAWWEYMPPVRLYNFIANSAAFAGENSVYIEQAIKSGDRDLIGAAIDRATKPITDGIRNAVMLLVLGGVTYVVVKGMMVKRVAKKIIP